MWKSTDAASSLSSRPKQAVREIAYGDERWGLMKKRVIPFALLAVCALGGCESSETTTKIAKLQDQIGRVAQQLSDTKKQVDGLQEANQRSVQALENLQATVERQHATTTPAPAARSAKASATTTKPLGEQDLASAAKRQEQPADVLTATVNSGHSQATGEIGSPPFPTAKDLQEGDALSTAKKETGATSTVSCSQVWKQLGQGRSPEAAARALGVEVAAIHACEQKIGRSGTGR
jgi:regulator of replication initiation timing